MPKRRTRKAGKTPARNSRGRFIKRTRSAAPARQRSSMPRRRSYPKRRSSGGRGGMFGGMMPKLMKVGVGAAGGLAAKLGGNFNSTWGPAAGMGAVGFVANNETLLTLAGMSIANAIPFGGTGGTGTGGGWY